MVIITVNVYIWWLVLLIRFGSISTSSINRFCSISTRNKILHIVSWANNLEVCTVYLIDLLSREAIQLTKNTLYPFFLDSDYNTRITLINIKKFTTVTKSVCATICICFDCIFCILICDVNTKNKKCNICCPH